MNSVIELLMSHRSSRSYRSEPVGESILEAIIEAARVGPTSVNSHEVSIIVTRDAETRAKIAEYAGGQPWIAKAPVFLTVIIDHHKTAVAAKMAGMTQVIHKSLEGYTVGVLDAGIVMTNLMIAARSFGLGVVPIGGFRGKAEAMVELLKLPPMTFPVVGLCLGHIDVEAPTKPKMPVAAFRHDEHYHLDAIEPAIADYDNTLVRYWQSLGRDDGKSYSDNIGTRYSKVYFPNIKPDAAEQGFTNEI